jgi:polysaccharide export outer membrane protein
MGEGIPVYLTRILAMIFACWIGTTVAAQSYRLQPGDLLTIEVLEDESLMRSVLILPDGTFSFPLAGTVRAEGQTVTEVRNMLVARLRDSFAAPPTVFVAVEELAPENTDDLIDVFITGQIEGPGRLEVEPGTTILQLIAEAGGLTRFAAQRRIQLRRTDPQTGAEVLFLFDFSRSGRRESIAGSTRLIPGDVVVVPERRLFE